MGTTPDSDTPHSDSSRFTGGGTAERAARERRPLHFFDPPDYRRERITTFTLDRPAARDAIALLACGATGYGLSLLFYLQAQRHIGAVRTGSVFATGPFVGAGLAWLLGDRQAGWATASGGLAFGVGVLLHLTERHSHTHVHHPLDHEHPHRHDDGHHHHQHEPAVAGEHTHWHRHELAEHEHEHAPDIHHGHEHS